MASSSRFKEENLYPIKTPQPQCNCDAAENEYSILQAVLYSDTEKLKKLLAKRENVNIVDIDGNSALHLAVIMKSNEMVTLLLEQSIHIDHQNHMGDTALMVALKNESTSCINQLLEVHCDVDIKNNMEDAALHLAVKHSTPEIIQLLIEHEADINAQNKNLFTPLHLAVYENKLPAVCVLLYYNADTSMLCGDGLTPFMYSIANLECIEISHVLFQYYDEFTQITFLDESTFVLALRCCSPFVVDLIKAGVNCGYTVADTGEALLYAFVENNFELFELIISQSSKDSIPAINIEMVLVRLFKVNSLPTSVVLKYFYLLITLIFESPYNYCDLTEYSLTHILNFLARNSIDLDTKECILWSFFSIGVNLDLVHLKLCFLLFGNKNELEILYQCYNREYKFYGVVPLQYFSCILKDKSVAILKSNLERSYVTFIYCAILEYNIGRIIKNNLLYIGYMSFSKNIVSNIENCEDPVLKDYILKASLGYKVPSLLELSRNAAALQIVKVYNITRTYQFFDIINRSDIPKCIKDILLFRKPVYPVNTI